MAAPPPAYRVLLSAHCNRVRCEADWHLGPDWAPRLRDYDLWFVSAGRGRMLTSDGEVSLAPGVGLWMRPGRRYEATHDPAAPLVVNFFHFTLAEPPPLHPARRSSPHGAPRFRRSHDAPHPDVARQIHPGRPRVRQRPLWRSPRRTGPRNRRPQRRPAHPGLDQHHREIIQRLVAEIREKPGAARTVAALAKTAGYSVDHFSRTFEKVTGQRPQELIIAARLARARQLLAETGLTISQIAETLGFRDVFFFSRQFTQRTGQTPSAYRAALSP